MIKTLIADDEQHAIHRLNDLLADYDEFQIIAEVNDGTKALEQIVALKPDVVFLDINMPGVSVFSTISSLQDPPLVVFQTAHSKYAADAFDINALDYLLKPISRERFQQTIEKINSKLSPSKLSSDDPGPMPKQSVDKDLSEKISIKVHGAIKIIPTSEIQKICFEDGLSFIYTQDGRFLSDHTLNHYEEKLRTQNFFRSNRANLINLEYMTTVHKGFKGTFLIELKDGSRIELSRRKAQTLKKMLDL
jgi:two-component system LytT family response regulator